MKVKNDDLLSLDGNTKESVYDRINELMKGRPGRECAQKWGVPHSTLLASINRNSDPKLSMLIKIANAENVSLEWLATGCESNEQQKPTTDSKAVPEDNDTGEKLIDVIKTMPPEAQRKLYMRIISKGFNSLDISERDDRILALVADMSDEHFKEIYAFVHKAKYMLLAGLPIGKPADVDSWDEKRA